MSDNDKVSRRDILKVGSTLREFKQSTKGLVDDDDKEEK